MTNIFRNQKGVATLLISVIMLVSITLIIFFAASYNRVQEKVISNTYMNNQAFEAAEGGLEFGIVYFQQNSSTITASPVNGYIPAYSSINTQNVALANGSKFSIAYTNPIQNNYAQILVTSTGKSSDATATRVVSQKIVHGSLLSTPPTVPLISKGSVSATGNSVINNPYSNSTINSASTVSINGSSQTVITGGAVGSNSASIGSDVQQHNATTAAMSNTTFFQTYFGTSESVLRPTVQHYYSNSSSTNYSGTLNGLTGTSIWIDQTGGDAKINGNTVIGSAANPVLIVVNGNLDLSGGATIYGFIYVIGGVATSITGNINIYGGVVSTDDLTLAGNTLIKFDLSVLSALQQQLGTTYYAKIPGTWKDF
jgi:Tfp pilus assembly protein PilX